jgi:D-threo-aldose 1-dehydrogenase
MNTGQGSFGRLALGVAPLGNLYSCVSDADADATLATALGHGIRLFDVAPLYGLGLAEQRLGRFLRAHPAVRPAISTKVGRVLKAIATPGQHEQFVDPLRCEAEYDYSAAGIERSYEDSLRRLGVDRVQVLLLHDIDRFTHPEDHRGLMKQVFDESLPTLQRLKAAGRVDAIGLGLNHWDVAYEVLASASVDYVLLAGRYTLLDQSAHTSGFLDACRRRGIKVLAGGVFNSGFLAGGTHYDYRPATDALLERRARLTEVCVRYNTPLPAAALQFTAAHAAIDTVVIGARTAREVDAMFELSRARIPPVLWDDLQREGLITHAPVR